MSKTERNEPATRPALRANDESHLLKGFAAAPASRPPFATQPAERSRSITDAAIRAPEAIPCNAKKTAFESGGKSAVHPSRRYASNSTSYSGKPASGWTIEKPHAIAAAAVRRMPA